MNWPAMIWVGGSPGAGKSTLALRLARANDLPLHAIDAWTYDHLARLPAQPPPDDWLDRGPEHAADAFEEVSRARLPLVLADVAARGLGTVPAMVEGPQLLPSLAAPLPPGYAVWVVTEPNQTRRAREQRIGANAERLEALVRRDAILTERMRAAGSGLPVLEVPVDPDWTAVRAAVEKALAPALRQAPRLTPGDDLRRQRRLENRTACRQIRLWRQDAGLGALPPFRFACECGQSGCQASWEGTPDDYDARTADGPLIAGWRTP